MPACPSPTATEATANAICERNSARAEAAPCASSTARCAAMPRGATDAPGGQRGSERGVNVSPLPRTRLRIDRGARERMTEVHAASLDGDELVLDRGVECGEVEAE